MQCSTYREITVAQGDTQYKTVKRMVSTCLRRLPALALAHGQLRTYCSIVVDAQAWIHKNNFIRTLLIWRSQGGSTCLHC